MNSLLVVLLLGLLPLAYGYKCDPLPPQVAGAHPGMMARYFTLPRKLRVSDTIIVRGKIGPSTYPYKRFWIDLFVGTNPVYWNSFSSLHFTPQYDLNKTFIGDYQPNPGHVFRNDVYLPLLFTDKPFLIRILVQRDGYLIYKDGKFIHKMKYTKYNYASVQTIFVQNIDLGTEPCCGVRKRCPSTGAGRMTFYFGDGVVEYIEGGCID
ncbi:unnamed protein product [Caenorhabditis auriculariae]|uniref:Galectin n=1 Tax=Caenorhabditis auriculariae TaxID=2777116 RepID=A0A8S1HE16_9PELO|nr:unnamed protein product [Caenorhabditis auriculariae]